MLWVIGQAGIVLEVLGAAFIVFSAFKSRKEISKIENPASYGGVGETSILVVKLIKNQFKNEAFGFFLLGLGLIMQFIGGFGST